MGEIRIVSEVKTRDILIRCERKLNMYRCQKLKVKFANSIDMIEMAHNESSWKLVTAQNISLTCFKDGRF